MDQKIIEKLDAYIDSKRDSIVKELMEIAGIESVAKKDSDVKPFGAGCKNVLHVMLEKGEKEGFKTHSYEDYLGSVKYDLGRENSIGMLAHLDVVPAGNDWTITNPYEPKIVDGYLYGRGVSDNKSAAIGGLYIIKALKEVGYETRNNIDLLLGTNEETGMADAKYYAKNYPTPKFTFVPDGGFPGVGGEFGRVRYKLISNRKLSDDFVELNSGSVFNIVPNVALCILKKDTAINYKTLPESIEVKETERGIEIRAFGVTTHAAMPENGKNAIKALTSELVKLEGIKEEDLAILKFIDGVNNDYYGSFLNIDMEDEVSGVTVASGTVLRLEDGIVSLINDCRRCVRDTNERLTVNITKKAEENDFSVEFLEKNEGYVHDLNGPVIQKIREVYVRETNDTENQISISKGGTYAGALPNAFATGICLKDDTVKGLPQGHGSAHQPDECMKIDDYIEGIKLLMHIILEVDEIL